jgi:lipopolysaccharide export system protein LptA
MRARDIDLAFYQGTQALERAVLSQQARLVQTGSGGQRSIEGNLIHFSTAPDGATLTSLEARDRVVVVIPPSAAAPAREIRAASLVATGNERAGLTDALFSGGVEFTESVPATSGAQASERSGTSRTLALDLAGQLDAIDAARFQEKVTFKDGLVSGLADLGTYVMTSGMLTLEPHPQRPETLPWVTDGTMRVDAARLIEIDLATHDLRAEGDVKTQSRRSEGRVSPSGAALFDGPEPVLGFGDKFWYVRSKAQVRYAGAEATTARLRQGESEVRGDELILDDRTSDLRATGRVESRLPIEAPGSSAASPAPGVYRATAATMVYLDDARTMEYAGAPVTLETPEGRTVAGRIVLTLADEGRRLQRMVATSDAGDPSTADVRSRLSEGRESLSDSLVYDATIDQYVLRGRPGRPLVLRMRGDDGTCSVLLGTVGYSRPGSSSFALPKEENPGGTDTAGNQPCSGPLTR